MAPDRPPLAALFLIDFDVKAGYTIVWRRAAAGLAPGLDGCVEYKSLPSGLHTVRADLVYFVHDGAHAGLSAFANEPCDDAAARNARMVAVGILVPLSYGRLGRAWTHAPSLEAMAAKLAKDRNMTEVLEQYWDAHRARESRPTSASEDAADVPPSPTLERKPSRPDEPASPEPALQQRLSPFHPAWSLLSLLDTFGPLIFPIHRAALLRRRILISCHAPVHQVCDFVYDISILSNIPHSLSDALPRSRLRPLFTIGVHDIPFLTQDLEASKRRQEGLVEAEAETEEPDAGTGWVACTTDSILAVKDTLWDMLITLPPEHSALAKDRTWPVVECPRGHPVKATQRDLRRFRSLRGGLARLAASAPPPAAAAGSPRSETSAAPSSPSRPCRPDRDEALDQLVEPLTWTAFAYNGYMWWASAGEQLHAEEQEEWARDAALLAALGPTPTPRAAASESMAAAAAPPRPPSRARPPADADADEARVELAVIAYFHRLTAQMLSSLGDAVDAADAETSRDDDDDDDNDDADAAAALLSRSAGDAVVAVDSRCVEHMGLDVWSAADAAFVQDLAAAHLGRAVRVEAKGIEVCGVRVC